MISESEGAHSLTSDLALNRGQNHFVILLHKFKVAYVSLIIVTLSLVFDGAIRQNLLAYLFGSPRREARVEIVSDFENENIFGRGCKRLVALVTCRTISQESAMTDIFLDFWTSES